MGHPRSSLTTPCLVSDFINKASGVNALVPVLSIIL